MIRIAISDIHKADKRRKAEQTAVSAALHALVPDAVVEHADNGAPFIVNRPDLSLSISHSSNTAVVAVADDGSSVGIDIEINRPAQFAKIASRFLGDTERVIAESRPLGMLEAWTAKEAVFKADRGRHVNFIAEIKLDSDNFGLATVDNGAIAFRIEHFGLGTDTLIAVATECGRHNIIEFVTLYEREDIPRRIDGLTQSYAAEQNIRIITVKEKPRKLVFATNNAHKLSELRRIVGARFDILSLSDIGCTDDIPEDSDTLEGNATAKAKWVVDRYGYDCFADDTGLEVDALGGAPGVHSARYAPGEGHDAAANTALLLKNLDGVAEADRTARFRTVIALILDGTIHLFEGRVEGVITDSPAGNGGFGYDPVFRPEGFDKTFAEISADEKNAVSHRGRATRRLIDFLDNLSD